MNGPIDDPPEWTQQGRVTDAALHCVHVVDASHAIAVGHEGTILRWSRDKWTRTRSGTKAHLFACWGASPENLWVAGAEGEIRRWDGRKWSAAGPAIGDDIYGLHGLSPDQLFAAGDWTTLLYWDGTGWTRVRPMRPEGRVTQSFCLRALSSSADSIRDVVAVGDAGAIVRVTRTVYRPISSAGGPHLLSTWGGHETEQYVVGEGGVVLHFGQRWSHLQAAEEAAVGKTLYCVWGSGAQVWMAGSQGIIIAGDGLEFGAERTGVEQDLHGLHGIAGGPVIAVGDAGTILHRKQPARPARGVPRC